MKRNKKAGPEVDSNAKQKRSPVIMIGKVVGGVIGSRIAEGAGKSGLLGGAAGMVVSRFVRKSPVGALVVGGAWVGHKLYKRSQERKFEAAAKAARPVKAADPATPPPGGGKPGSTAS